MTEVPSGRVKVLKRTLPNLPEMEAMPGRRLHEAILIDDLMVKLDVCSMLTAKRTVNGTKMDRERNGNASGMVVSPKLPKIIQK